MKLKKNIFINIFLLIISFLFFFIFFELFFRSAIIDFYWGSTKSFNPDFFSTIKNNNTKIIFLGDSQTASYPNNSYPNMLDLMLKKRGYNIDIYNLGISGTGPKTYYYRLKTYNDLIKPKIIVIGFYVGNDLFDTYRPIPRSILRFPYYFISNYFLTVPYLNQIMGQLIFFQNIKKLFVSEAEKSTKLNQFNDTNMLPQITGRFFREAKDYPNLIQDSILVNNDISKKQLISAENYILKIKNLGKKYNSTILLLIIPSSAQVDKKYYEFFYDYIGYKTDKQKLLNSSNIQNELKSFAEANNILYLDLLPYFKSYDDYVYYFNDIHLNDKGQTYVAQILSNKIIPLINNSSLKKEHI